MERAQGRQCWDSADELSDKTEIQSRTSEIQTGKLQTKIRFDVRLLYKSRAASGAVVCPLFLTKVVQVMVLSRPGKLVLELHQHFAGLKKRVLVLGYQNQPPTKTTNDLYLKKTDSQNIVMLWLIHGRINKRFSLWTPN